MAACPGLAQAFFPQLGIEFLQVLGLRTRGEKTTSGYADLPFHLPLFPAGSRRAGHRLEQVMRTQLLETLVEIPVLAGQDRLHGGLHVVVDAAPGGSAEKGKRLNMRVEDHLLGFPGIGEDQTHAAVAEPDMRDLDPCRDAAEHGSIFCDQ